MRILCQSDGYLPDVIGGVEVLSAHLFEHLRQRGHEVLVITSGVNTRPVSQYYDNGITIHKLELGAAMLSGQLRDIARVQMEVNDAVLGFQPDVLQLNATKPSNFFFLRRGKLRDIPRVLTLHSPLSALATAGLQNRLAVEADVVVAVSQSIADDAIKFMPSLERKLIVIRNALPHPSLQPSPLPTRPVNFLCFGRVAEEKGMDVAIEALAILYAQGMTANLVIAGGGPHRKALEQLVRDRALQERVHFRGWVRPADIPATINDSTAVLMPSRWKEPFGLAALQAAQMGRPVIASRLGGLQEVVAHGETGLLVAPDNAAALASAMADLMRNTGMAREMGSNARLRAERTFDFNVLVTSYEKAYSCAKQRQFGTACERQLAS
jgi:glycosyltransferase involved in cell wall biosynthesis